MIDRSDSNAAEYEDIDDFLNFVSRSGEAWNGQTLIRELGGSQATTGEWPYVSEKATGRSALGRVVIVAFAVAAGALWLWNSKLQAAQERRSLSQFPKQISAAFDAIDASDAVEDDVGSTEMLGRLQRELRKLRPEYDENIPVWHRLMAQVDSLNCIRDAQIEEFEQAISSGRAAVEVLERDDTPAAERALGHYALGKALFESARRTEKEGGVLFKESIGHFAEAIAVVKSVNRSELPVFGTRTSARFLHARILLSLGVAVHKSQGPIKALELYDEAAQLLPELREKSTGSVKRLWARYYADRGQSLVQLGSDGCQDAIEGYTRGLEVLEDTNNHYLKGILHSNRADALTEIGSYDAEIADRDSALLQLRQFSKQRRTVNWLDNLILNSCRKALALFELGLLDEAIESTRMAGLLTPIESRHRQMGLSQLTRLVLMAASDEARSKESRNQLLSIAADRLEERLSAGNKNLKEFALKLEGYFDLPAVTQDDRLHNLMTQMASISKTVD